MDATILVVVGVIASIFLLLNVLATHVMFNTYFEIKGRRVYQILFIWLIPVFGAIFAIYINREDYFEQKTRKKQIGNQTSITDSDATTHHVGSD